MKTVEDWALQIKSPSQILEKCRELVRRHRRRFLLKNLKPCPWNCNKANMIGQEVVGCSGCDSINPENCTRTSAFVPIFTKQELVEQFSNQLRDPEVLLHRYRDLVSFFWCIGVFDSDMQKVDEKVLKEVEWRNFGTDIR
jgi:hypothetical protein